MIRAGLCSVTFRQLTAEQIVDAAARAQLDVIEWGGDVHVPPGDTARAVEVARVTADAGLAVCSYGSYFRASAGEDLTPILDSAEALGADRIRIWAGSLGSADASAQDWGRTVDRIQDAVAAASTRGIALALEFHSGTLADTAPTTLRLLADVDSSALTTYWQPTVAAPDDVALDEYATLSAHVSAAHVFSWWPVKERLPLHARDGLWRRFFEAAAAADHRPRDALLEFIPGADPDLLAAEAATLRSYLV
ncbi:MAG TPA: sugar phosphate isomerase [Microbacterium sp.]|nr:sugar phosphate isomerase [Microbacterium sp.]